MAMNEKPSQVAGSGTVAGGTQSKPASPDVGAAVQSGTQPSAPVAQPVAAVPKPPVLFGGHKGGGKKRADGLVAGSEEAKAVDREKNRVRMADKRAAQKASSLPPALARPADAAPNASVPLAAGEPPLAPAVAGAAGVLGMAAAPTFVAWTQKMLERPTRLFTRIVDRFRTGALMRRIHKLGLPKDVESEAEKRMRYKEDQIADFNSALSNCMVIELNKRRVPGAEHSHWLELGMTGGELINCHLDTVDWLEKQILAKAEAEKKVELRA